MADLTFRVHEPGKGVRTVPLAAGFSVGRSDDNTCVIADAKCSGRHFQVIADDDGGLAVEDLGSSNGTRIDGGPELVAGVRHPLTVGTVVVAGSTRFEVAMIETEPAGKRAAKTVAAHISLGGGADGGEAVSALAELAAFKTARPRLVFCNEAIRRIDDLDKIEVLVGRQQGECQVVLEHPAVSGRHAAIRFQRRRFFVEDLGSSNGTYLGTEMLPPQSPRELKPETHIRFGGVDALFVVDCGADGSKPDPKRYDATLDLLVNENKISKLQRERAERDARDQNRHAGEILLTLGFVSVDQWVNAYGSAEMFRMVTKGGQRRGIGKGALVVIIGAATIVGLVLLFKSLM